MPAAIAALGLPSGCPPPLPRRRQTSCSFSRTTWATVVWHLATGNSHGKLLALNLGQMVGSIVLLVG